jgi:hypothetical protein
MAKLVILNQGMTGRTFDLSIDRTTVGRVEDNTFQIADGSVSSHHAEILLRGTDIVVKDLNSTNGSYLNGEKFTEIVLKPGQILRFGQVELKIDDGSPLPAPGSIPVPSPAGTAPTSAPVAPAKKAVEGTMVMTRGVSLTDLEQSGTRPAGFEAPTTFSKKSNKINKYFLVGGIAIGVIIVGLILFLIYKAGAR